MARYINFDVGTAVVTAECYALITSSGPNAGHIWSGSTNVWGLYNEANYNTYVVPIIEYGGSGMCQIAIHEDMDIQGLVFGVSVRRKPSAGATPVPTDTTLLQFEYRIQSAIDSPGQSVLVK